MHGRRLIAMLFDLSSMQPEEAFRAATAARDYVEKKLTPADMVAITVLSTTLRVVQDFTSDRELLLQTIDQMSGVEGQGSRNSPPPTRPTSRPRRSRPTTPSSRCSTPTAGCRRSRR